MALSESEWNKCRAKSRLPKTKIDLETLQCALKVLNMRIACYPTTIEVLSPSRGRNWAKL
jgi:hypothetical protein